MVDTHTHRYIHRIFYTWYPCFRKIYNNNHLDHLDHLDQPNYLDHLDHLDYLDFRFDLQS